MSKVLLSLRITCRAAHDRAGVEYCGENDYGVLSPEDADALIGQLQRALKESKKMEQMDERAPGPLDLTEAFPDEPLIECARRGASDEWATFFGREFHEKEVRECHAWLARVIAYHEGRK